jgi:apolipoprotein N-acyltransferase
MLDKVRDWYRSTWGHALVSALVLWAALPPADLWPLAWVAPVWWVLLVRRKELSGRRPYRAIWTAGFLFWLAALHWMRLPHWLTGIGWVALAFYLAFYLPVFIGLGRVAVHRLGVPVILAAPIVWTGLELVRGHLLTGFTMASLGHTQYRWIELIQLSDLAGAYGVGFLVMFVAACLARAVPSGGKPWSSWPLVPAATVLVAALVYGHLRVSREQAAPQARIALIQGSIDIVLNPPEGTQDRMHKHYRELSQQAVDRYSDLDLIIWPETVFGRFLFDYDPHVPVPDQWNGSKATFLEQLEKEAARTRGEMRAVGRQLDTPLLVGVATFFFDEGGSKHFNSAAFVPLDDGPIGRYDKMHRVVFGEYVPFAEELSWLVKLTPLSSLNIAVERGAAPAAFDVAGLRIAPNICYESVMPQVIRRQVNTLAEQGREPDVLVNLTNDGWFWGSSELDMHLACGVFRAVECRKPFLIAANTGFSAWIDADGRILAQGPRRATGVLLAEVAPERRTSWYLTWGDWPAGICLAACLLFAAVGTWARHRNRWAAKPAGPSPSTEQSKPGKANRPRSRAGRGRRSRSCQRP